ncbi:hypothetical protein [Phocaeicola plebeius]|uniref:hypothetical protein n=1 Tax=Phocaeicola plebeius TaxID=310297 RepID=UPI0026EDA675|nr:hypothetical protein [Phocaeicola plebeius]MCI6051401.1 hypothetical protein [Phocaeicola plebeius]MDD6913357.1 hypothetical protein [Phocaeicola plebeius]MDY5978000.1 hypothetical protein [Phocaeicola plebeius]
MSGKSRGVARPASAGRWQAGGGTRQGCDRGISDSSGALFNFLKRMCAHRRQPAQFLRGEGTAVRKNLMTPCFQRLS